MNNCAENAHVSLIGTVILGTISWFTPENIDMGLKILTGFGAIVSGALAARYYWYATKEKKEKLKQMKD